MQIFLDRFVRKLLNVWQVRVMVLLSLSLQIILIIFGSRRKKTAKSWIIILVWSAYLTADWVATVALGNLAISLGSSDVNSRNPNNYLQAFWAPFLLLHLGGPDSITAYALEDNELWLRHFLELLVQVAVAFYVFLRSWSNYALTFITIPMFIVGIIKYGERTWVLRSSSTKNFRISLLLAADPGLEFDEFVDHQNAANMGTKRQNINTRDHYLCLADFLFKRFKYLFADLILGHKEQEDGNNIMIDQTPENAFKIVEIELGFMYDVLYTKAIIIYSKWGIFLRCISTLSTISALISFLVIIDKRSHPITDIFITYILLVGAIVLEVYAFIVLIFSDWTKVWWIKQKCRQTIPTPDASSSPHSHLTNCKSWSRSLAQYNLINSCLKDRQMKCVGVQKIFGIKETLEKYLYMNWEKVNDDLQVLIFEQLQEKAKKIRDDLYDIKLGKELLAQRGGYVLKKWNCRKEFKWTTVDVEFDHSLLLWHIATDLCYYDDLGKNDNFPDSKSKCSKLLSDYMLYLLVICPFMLPSGIGEKRYKDTCATAMSIFNKQRREVISNCRSACSALLQAVTTRSLEDLKGDKSVLFYGCKLSKQLQLLVSEEGWSKERKWEMISEVWVEMLAYAASHCGWKEHAQQLRNGGELLTHVCLLMAHFGLSKQYQIENQNTESDTKALVQALESVRVLQLEHPQSLTLLKTIEKAIEQETERKLEGELKQAFTSLRKLQSEHPDLVPLLNPIGQAIELAEKERQASDTEAVRAKREKQEKVTELEKTKRELEQTKREKQERERELEQAERELEQAQRESQERERES